MTLLALLALVLGAALAFNIWAQRRLTRELDLLKEAGASLDPEAFLPTLQEGEPNASDILDAAGHLDSAARTEAKPPFDLRRVRLDQAADADLLKLISAWLDRPKHRLLLDVIDAGSEIERARFPRSGTGTHDLETAWQEYPRLRITSLSVARLLRLRALENLERGQTSAAFEDARRILRMSNWIGTEQPNMLSAILSVAVGRVGLLSLEELMQRALPEPGTTVRLEVELRRLRTASSAKPLEAERAFSYRIVQGTPEGALPLPVPLSPIEKWISPGFTAATTTEILAGFSQLIRFAETPPHARPSAETLTGEGSRSPFRAIARILIPNLLDGVGKLDQQGTEADLALIALAHERYSLDHLAYPTDLRQLVPDYLDELPLDRFSGAPLRRARREGRCVLYSVGRNGDDDGGTGGDLSSGPQDGADDLGWRLPCAPAAPNLESTSSRLDGVP